MSRSARRFLVLGALIAALSVILSAYVAHAPGLNGGGMVQTALAQQQFHALVPWGGTAFILGWLAMAAGVLSARRDLAPSRGSDR
jgi:uncharacterized membrane protein YgdD (TMEM256/DUF423 family)